MRVFAASSIERFEDVEKLVAELSGIRGSKPVRTPELHLTYRFFGELDGRALEATREEFRKIQGSAFELKILGIDAFPRVSSANVLFLKVVNNDEIQSNWSQIASLSPKEKIGKEFVPHITVSRFRNSYDCRDLANRYEKLTFSKAIKKISLYKSELGKDGPTYTEIDEIQLK